ncbi:MAG: methyltransferase domain-containing protein [Victivallales bacterium]|nr:methyltransferase domain-containing protein [Victivallales bacterium]
MFGLVREGEIQILTSAYGVLDLACTDRRVELDIGCGKGGFATALAQRYPNSVVIAADVMLGRLRKLSKAVVSRKLDNMKVLRVEATHLTGYILPDNTVDRVHLMCPDPWPKKRHKDNRLLNSQFTGSLGRILKPGGVFHLSSDSKEYFDSALKVVSACGLFSPEDSSLIDDIKSLTSDFERRWHSAGLDVRHAAWKRLD